MLYALLGYNYCDWVYLGPITAIATVTTDILVLMLIKANLANGPVKIVFILVSNRAFLFGFGGEMWFIGYCLLYIIFAIFLYYEIM